MNSKEYPEICIYIGESIDGKGSGEMLYILENRPAVRYYFQNEYTFGFKSILMGRATFEEVLVADKKMNKIIMKVYQLIILIKKIFYLN